MATETYTAKDIQVLEGLEPVRKRPGMYIGGVGSAGLHHLVWEIVDNSVDEVMNGHAKEITVTLHKDGSSITVSDDGRGIPVDMHPKHKKPALELIFSHAARGREVRGGQLQDFGRPPRRRRVGRQRAVDEARRDGQARRRRVRRWSSSAATPPGTLKKLGAGARHGHDGLLPARPDHLPAHRVRRRRSSASASRSRATCTAA